MKRILLITFMLVSALATESWAQTRSVTGKVTSAEDGSTLPGVNVILKGTTTGTVTDIDGNYSLNVPEEGGTLTFTFIGLATQEVQIGARSVVDVNMESDVKQLGEVVVTAFGIEREKKALSYAVQEVDGSVITNAGTPNTVNALQGKVAGVQINQSSGMPGSSSFMRIRGSNSFDANNQPLFVIDGMPIESQPSDAGAVVGAVSGTDYSSRSLDINPNDIETISVLKGPAAAALYGMRASNGVVIITTKSGKNVEMGKPTVNFSQSILVNEVSRLPDLQNTYAQGAGGNYSPGASTSWGPKISDLANPAFNSSATGDGTYINNVGEEVRPQIYDNVSPMFEKGLMSTTNLDVLGRNDRATYAFGVGYTKDKGVIPTTELRRINLKLKGEYNITDNLKSGASVNYANTDIDKLAGGSNLSNVLFTTYWAPISYDLWGTPFATEENPYQQIHYRGAMDNPRWSLVNNNFNEKVDRVFGNAFLEYHPLEWLSVKYQIGLDNYTETRKEVYGLGSGGTGGRGAVPGGGQITDAMYTLSQVNSNATVAFNKVFAEDFGVNVLIGNEIYDIRTNFQQQIGTGIQIGGLDNISNTTTQTVTSTTTQQRTVGFYGNANLSFKEYLFLNVTGRQDYVSNMPRGNRTFFYPSVGLSFVFTDAFGINNDIINFGKISGSYAEVGQPGPLQFGRIPFIPATILTGFTGDGIVFPFKGQTGFEQSDILRSPDLVPQNTKTWEIGLELQLLQNRLGIDATYFSANTTDQIFQVPVAASTGYLVELRNAGELEGNGIELTLKATPVRIGDFSWDLTTNFTKIENKVISLAPGVDNIFLGGFVEPNVRAFAGNSYPIIFGSRFQRDGEGNIVVDSRQLVNGNPNPAYGMPFASNENGPIGNVNPDWEAGITNTFSFKGLSLNVHVDIREGGMAYAGNTRLQRLYGMDAVTEDRETPVVLEATKGYLNDDGVLVNEGTNDISILKGQYYWNTALDGIDESSVYETSFIRLREVMLSYALPSSILENTIISNASIYLMARNLMLITDYPNFDPETSVGGASNFQGLEYVNLPQTRSYGGGLRITF